MVTDTGGVTETRKPVARLAVSDPVFTVTVCAPGVAATSIANVAVRCVSSEALTLVTVTPVPPTVTTGCAGWVALKCVKLPMTVTFTVAPWLPAPGETEDTVGGGLSVRLEADAPLLKTEGTVPDTVTGHVTGWLTVSAAGMVKAMILVPATFVTVLLLTVIAPPLPGGH